MANEVQDRPSPGGITRAIPWDPNTEQPYDSMNPAPVQIAGADQPIDVHSVDTGLGHMVAVQKNIAAAGNYTAGDVVSEATAGGTAWHFEDCARANGEPFMITAVRLSCDEDSITSMAPRLHFFRRNPTGSERDDNDPKSIVIADMGHYLGWIDCPVFTDLGTISATLNDDVRKEITPDLFSRDLYMILETLTAETAETASMLMRVELEIAFL